MAASSSFPLEYSKAFSQSKGLKPRSWSLDIFHAVRTRKVQSQQVMANIEELPEIDNKAEHIPPCFACGACLARAYFSACNNCWGMELSIAMNSWMSL